MMLEKHKDANGYLLMKVVKQDLSSFFICVIFEKESPFVKAADKFLLKLLESDINNKWEKQFSSEEKATMKSIVEKEFASISVTIPLLFVRAIGYSVSLVVFIGEKVSKYIEDLIHKCILFSIQGSVG